VATFPGTCSNAVPHLRQQAGAPVTSDAHIAGQAAFEAETAPHEENFVSSRRKFCFIA